MTCSPQTASRGPIALAALLLLMALMPVAAHGQAELLPIDHPATRALIRFYEFGAIPDFPREHLPISRGQALRFLDEARRNAALPDDLREQAQYYAVELGPDVGLMPMTVLIPTTDASHWIVDDPMANIPFAIAEHRDTALGLHVVFEPLLDGDLRVDPATGDAALIAQGGAQLRGTILDHVGFSARITNGSVAGDSTIAARDPRIGRNGAFGITAFGRDLSFGDGHLRADFEHVAVEIGHEAVQLGGGDRESLLLGSLLPSHYDYLRFNAHVGRFTFSHIHAMLLGEATGAASGPSGEIPAKYVATHLLSVGPFAGMRLSIGESVVYHGRALELGYLNPFVFLKTQEQYLRDRDNANLYLALSVAPLKSLFLEGEAMIDDLRFSLIGDGYWGNKGAYRATARVTAFPLSMIDLGFSYTWLDPYVFTHFNRLNNYTHDGTLLVAAGLQPNSYLMEGKLALTPLPNLSIRASIGIGKHGANIFGGDSLGNDTLLFNAGGDVRQTRRAGIDAETVHFLDGDIEQLLQFRFEAEYEPLRNIYLRLNALRYKVDETTDTQVWLGLRIGAR